MDAKQVVKIAGTHLRSLSGHRFNVLALAKPVSPDAALNLAKVISKLSPLLGNLIEFNTVEFLNGKAEFKGIGRWTRQDPDFPERRLRRRGETNPWHGDKGMVPACDRDYGKISRESESLHRRSDRYERLHAGVAA